MAIPSIQNNTPSSGLISWGAFTIQLYGVAYSVAAGNTSYRWVWWRYNGGSPVIEGGSEVPATLTDDDLVLFANKNGIGVRVQSSNFVDGELLVDGSIFADALSTNLINSQHIVTAGLDAGVIKFGTMSGDRIMANTISAEKLTVGAIGPSAIVNGGFEDDVWWIKGVTASRDPAAAASGGFGMRLTASASVGLSSPNIPIAAGDQLVGVISARGNTGPTGLYLRLSFRNASNVELAISDAVGGMAVPVGTWTDYAAAFNAAPAGTTTAVLQVYNTQGVVDIDDIDIAPVIISARIADGAINTQKVITTGLDASVIKFGTMSGDRISALTINSGHVVTTGLDAGVVKFGTMSGDRITANTINSGHVITSGLDAGVIKFGTMSGDRITSNTINSGHVVTAGLDAGLIRFGTMSGDRINAGTITGVTITGATVTGTSLVRTGTSGARVEMGDWAATGGYGGSTLKFYGTTGGSAGYIASDTGDTLTLNQGIAVVGSTIRLSNGSIRFTPGGTTTGTLTLEGGTINLNAAIINGGAGSVFSPAKINLSALGIQFFNNSGNFTITRLNKGRKNTGSANASGQFTIAHGLGVVPIHVQLTPANKWLYSVVSLTSTDITVMMSGTGVAGTAAAGNIFGTAPNGTLIDCFWEAVA